METRRRVRTFRWEAGSPWSWLVLVALFCVGAVLAFVFLTAFLVLLGAGILAAPILRWRMRKRLEKVRDQLAETDERRPSGRVIDVEYTIDDGS